MSGQHRHSLGSRVYPFGVPSWVDTWQPDPQAATRFYGGLLGWTFTEAMPPDAPGSYLVAALDGHDAAAVSPVEGGVASWNTYVSVGDSAVRDADTTAAAVIEAGGAVITEPWDAGPGGRTAACRDPQGGMFHLWQARRRLGVQVVNVPGAWNFSDLHTSDPAQAVAFYGRVFGWVAADYAGNGTGPIMRVPGYGDHLAATVDPGIAERQAGAGAPEGFEDAVGAIVPAGPGEETHWHVTFSVADRDVNAATAESLGATVLSHSESPWARLALVRDPQGAEFTISEFTP